MKLATARSSLSFLQHKKIEESAESATFTSWPASEGHPDRATDRFSHAVREVLIVKAWSVKTDDYSNGNHLLLMRKVDQRHQPCPVVLLMPFL